MKEITRIHIAKTAYDIEIDAKKELEGYTKELEHYASDPEILDDIEIRITELLAEHGVAAGGVIAKKDVAAVRAQLGEPSDFAAEGAETYAADAVAEPRRVYRDEDNAVLGGVLAGFARFFGIDPLWARLAFIVVLFASFGTALLIYLILWFIIPPAQTASDRLRMSGRSVTLASIKELAGTGEQRSQKAQAIRRALSGLMGALLVTMAIAGLIAIIVAIFSVNEWKETMPGAELESWWFLTATGLFVLSGLLFSTLCFLLASAAFRRQWTKRIGVAVVAIITAGLVAFTSGVMIGYVGIESEQKQLEAAMVETKMELPSEFQDIKRLVASAHTIRSDDALGYSELKIQYRVDTYRPPRYELTALPDIKPDIKIADGQARVVLKSSVSQQRAYGWVRPELTIYGPALDEIVVEQGNFEYIADIPDGQHSLKVSALGTTQVTTSGTFTTLDIRGAGQVDASMSTVTNLITATEAGATVQAGVVRSLNVTQPDVCPAGNSTWDEARQNQVLVRGISGGDFRYNNSKRAASSVIGACGQVVVGDDEEQ